MLIAINDQLSKSMIKLSWKVINLTKQAMVLN